MNFRPSAATADVAVATIAHNFNYIQHSNYNSNSNTNNNSIHQHSIFADATKTTMEWTNDDALELIEQYRVHTELWNRADPKYKDKLCRFRAWSEIAERFGCSKAEVERKMNVLLTQYRREKHKMLVKLYEGIQPSPSKWYAFKRFDFMEVGGGSGSVVIGSGGGNGGNANGRSSVHLPSHNAELTNGGLHHQHHHSHHLSSNHHNPHHHQHQHQLGATHGHQQQQHHHHHHGATMNGLASFERTAASAAAAAAAAATANATISGTTTPTIGTPTGSLHRRMKSKEMKYFGAMGLNLPLLIANSQNMDTWNAVGQFSPPIDRGQLRVPLPMSFTASTPQTSELNVPNVPGARSLFGGSSNSDYTASPQKPMDTSDIEDKDDVKPEHNRTTPIESLTRAGSTPGAGNGATSSGAGGGGSVGGGGGGSSTRNTESVERDVNSSPIPNTNTHEAHKAHTREQLQQQQQQQDDLEIKQELGDYFHAPHPPAPADSQRSYSSTDENRLSNADAEDFAQDLRVTAAAAAAAAKSLDFSQFVLPRNLRRSTESSSIDEKYTPLNMRKLSANSATGGSQMLMSSLLAHESMSDDTTSVGGADSGHLKNSTTQETTAAAAAALYAECLNKDDCDFIGANVSLKLRAMDRTQRIIAEKLISEVLFYGQFNELERSARIMPK